MDRLWAEAHNFACDNLNRTAISLNKDMKSPYEKWHGEKPPSTLLQWFQPCFFKVKRKHKADAQAKPGFYLGTALNHPRDCLLYTSPSPRDKRQSRMPSSA